MSKCGECLMNTVDVTELLPSGICPKCGADYSAWQQTHKLKPTGAAHSDKLLAARINLRKESA